MNFLILGEGPEELAWAEAIANSTRHHVVAAYPGFLDSPAATVPNAGDLDDALGKSGVEAVLVGGPPEFRAEALRRVAAEGIPAICLHPPGPDSEAYYLVAMSRAETGAVLVPDLTARLHPAVAALREGFSSGFLGEIKSLKYEVKFAASEGDLVRDGFARGIDLVRAIAGEIDAANASGDPPGEHPDSELVVQLRVSNSRRAEVRLNLAAVAGSCLSVTGTNGSASLEFGDDPTGPARLVFLESDRKETVREFESWDARTALLSVLAEAVAGRTVHPDLVDGTRAMEISEAVSRSLRRGRTVELHYEEISEQGTFKSVMTSVGCLVLMSILFVLPLALAGPVLGAGWTIYLAYLIPPVLVAFILMQLFRFTTRGPGTPSGTRVES